MTPLLCALFFLSGVAALLFETLWFRQAGLTFGNSVWASSLVLASFMAGLALGNGLVARHGARIGRPVRAYALLEVAIGAGGLALVWGLPGLTPWIAPLLRPFQELPWILNALRLAIGFVLLLVPATAMGATLPVLVKALRARDRSTGSVLGRLYAWNTLGAVVGALAGELVLIEAFGVRGSGALAAGLNGVAALAAFALARGGREATPAALATARAPVMPGRVPRILLAAFLAGGILLAFEVVWFRFLHLFVHSGSASFAWMLAVVLTGIGLGGGIGGAWLRHRSDAWRQAPAVALLAGALGAALYAGFLPALRAVGGLAKDDPLYVAWLAAAIGLPVALLSGVLFPLFGAALDREIAPETRAAGLLTMANTVGAALGSLAGGFLLLPLLGMERAIFVLAGLYGAVAWLGAAPREAPRGAAGWLPVALFAGALALFPHGRMRSVYLQMPVQQWHRGFPHEVTAVREGRTETVVYVTRLLAGEPHNHFLLTDNYSMSGTSVFSRRYMKLFVYWPVALRPDPRTALLISYGVGSTARALVDTPSLESIDVVDISREILELSDVVFPDPAEHPLHDPRVRVHVEDGRYFLQMAETHYDLITAEPPPPKAAGVVNLYTREYFGLIRQRLAPGGVTTYWLPMHNLLESDARSIIRGFCDVFADCSLWVGHDLNWMLAGSRDAEWSPSEAGFSAQWRDPVVARELREVGFERPSLLGTTFLADAPVLDEIAGDAEPLTDDFPKRLSDRLQTRPGVFHAWMDVDVARARFERSDFVRAAWPPALREQTLADFGIQRVVNRIARKRAVGFVERLEVLDRLLDDPGLSTLPLWQLGTVGSELRAIDASMAKGGDARPFLRQLAVRALAARDYAGAVELLRRARRNAPRDAGLFQLELYALCRDGRVAEAEAEARGAGDPRSAGWAPLAAWLRERFGFAPDV
jgi:spermidine synthase